MDDQLPDFDDPIAFVIDDGQPVGPIALGIIVASVVSGDRKPDSLVWWADASGWIRFSDHSDLRAMLEYSQAASPQVEATDSAEADQKISDQQEASPKLTGLFGATASVPDEEVDLPQVSRVEVDAAVTVPAESAHVEAPDSAPSAAMREMSLAAALAGHLTESRAVDTGVDVAGDPPSTEVLEPEQLSADHLEGDVEDDLVDTKVDDTDVDEAEIDETAADVDEIDSETEPEQSSTVDSDLDVQFAEMVRQSEEHQRRLGWETRVDEVIFSACVALIAEGGFIATDLVSREADRHVAFEHGDDDRRVSFQMTPLSQINPAGDHVGRHMRVAISWGGEVHDVDSAFTVIRTLASDEPKRPGEIRADIDLESSIVSTEVDLIWAATDFIGDDYIVDRDVVGSWITASLHALEQRWTQLFTRRR